MLRSACEVPWVEEAWIVFEDGTALSIFQGFRSEPSAFYGWLYSNTEATPGKGYGGADVMIQLQMLSPRAFEMQLNDEEFVEFQLEGIHLPAGGGSSGGCAAAFPDRICSMQHHIQCKGKAIGLYQQGCWKQSYCSGTGGHRMTAILISRFAIIFDGTLQVHRADAVEDNADRMRYCKIWWN